MYEYDSVGRMKYNPEIHFNHKKPWSVKDLAYLCKFYKYGEGRNLAFTLGRTEAVIYNKAHDLRKENKFEEYKNLWDKLEGVS